MFNHSTTVLFLTRGIAHVTHVANTRIVKTERYEWSSQSLPKLFARIRQNIGNKPIRVLLADEFSYILELVIPVHILNKRLHIEQQLKTHIPEVLHSNEWDYQEIKSSKGQKALVFAPVKYVYDALLKASETSSLHIEAVEPVQIAGRRHKNPVIGLAIKSDLKGRDEEVLNVIPAHHIPTPESGQDEDKTQKSSSLKTIGLVCVTILLIAGSGYIMYSQFTKPRATIPTGQPSPTIEQAASSSAVLEQQPETIPSLTETPTEEITLDLSIYTVRVLNGTGVAGASTEVKNLLANEGFEEVTTGNADNFEYEETIIQRKQNVPSDLVPRLTQILSDYDIEESDILTTDEPYDVLIIVGNKI